MFLYQVDYQLMLSNFNKIEIEYVGTISDFNRAPITSAAVSGILKPSLSDINMINAPSIAREKSAIYRKMIFA